MIDKKGCAFDDIVYNNFQDFGAAPLYNIIQIYPCIG